MRCTRLYVGAIPGERDGLPLRPHATETLPPEMHHRLAHVLRLQVGDHLELFDGVQAMAFPAQITQLRSRAVAVTTGAPIVRQTVSPLTLHLYQGLARWETMDWVIQKAVELGVAAITPVLMQHSQARVRGKSIEARMQHWYKIMVHAAEQSGRLTLPTLHPLARMDDVSWHVSAASWLWYGHDPRCVGPDNAGNRLPLEARPIDWQAVPRALALCVGPEGGFSVEELQQLRHAGGQALALGPRVLRTETAALAMLAICQARFGDLNNKAM